MKHILQNGFVQTQIAHKLPKLAILFVQLPQPAKLRHAQTAVLLLPVEKRR
ncbi:hypothetical protein HDE78_001015 [Rhodanobacter sp. K2T2]|nr:hypothetical protein [Rhodanobacter sp. K2T2]